MKKISEIMKMLIKTAAAGMISLVILSGFCLIYSYSGVHISNPSGSTDYKWEPGQWKATMTEGMAWLRMDQNGYNNVNDWKDDIDILLMGGSHMEGVEVAASENTGYLLNQELSDYVYNIGTSGHVIYSCVKNVKAAVDEFKPAKYVIMETGTVELSKEEMQSVLAGTYKTIPSYDSGIVYQLQKYFPVVKSIYKQMSDWRSKGERAGSESSDGAVEKSSDLVYDGDYFDTLTEFIKKASDPVSMAGSKLIIFYHPSSSVDQNGKYVDTTDSKALKLFRSACDANDVIFVELTNEFQKLYEEEHVLAHGFSNTVAGEGHLNKYGHRVIAQTLAERIRE